MRAVQGGGKGKTVGKKREGEEKEEIAKAVSVILRSTETFLVDGMIVIDAEVLEARGVLSRLSADELMFLMPAHKRR